MHAQWRNMALPHCSRTRILLQHTLLHGKLLACQPFAHQMKGSFALAEKHVKPQHEPVHPSTSKRYTSKQPNFAAKSSNRSKQRPRQGKGKLAHQHSFLVPERSCLHEMPCHSCEDPILFLLSSSPSQDALENYHCIAIWCCPSLCNLRTTLPRSLGHPPAYVASMSSCQHLLRRQSSKHFTSKPILSVGKLIQYCHTLALHTTHANSLLAMLHLHRWC